MLKIFILSLFAISFNVAAAGYKVCATWDTFCKSPEQIVATKCRLGVQVKKEQCAALGINPNFYFFSNSSLEGLPVTTLKEKGI
jgi:hypothetical protein